MERSWRHQDTCAINALAGTYPMHLFGCWLGSPRTRQRTNTKHSPCPGSCTPSHQDRAAPRSWEPGSTA